MSAREAASVVEDGGLSEEHKLAFRLALAAAFGFTIGHLLGWDFPFLPPLFAVQLLTATNSLNLKQAVGFVGLMVAGCALGILVAQTFIQTPLVLILVIALLVFLSYLMLARGVFLANVALITVSVVPLTAVTSLDSAYALVSNLISGSVLAVLLVFLAYAIFPAQAGPKKRAAPTAMEASPIRAALANGAVLMSLVILFMFSGSPVSVIVLITALTILRQPDVAKYTTAWAYFMGNLAGGLAATAAYFLVTWLSSPVFLLLVGLLFGLVFGGRIAKGGQLASVYGIGLATFLIVLGIGLAPLPSDSGTVFIERIVNVVAAAAYTIGIASVTRWLLSVPNKDVTL